MRLSRRLQRTVQLLLGGVILLVLLVTTVYWQPLKESRQQSKTATSQNARLPQTPEAPKEAAGLPAARQPQVAVVVPAADYFARVTKKPFGIYVSPTDSPVQPERFTGYHTGADAEYGDITADVPVYAVAAGTVVTAEYASGYGGVMVVKVTIKGKQYLTLYGHVRPSSMLPAGTSVAQGQKIAVLGTAYSQETDGERRNLHFAVLKGLTVNITGYVQSQAELSGWYDPVAFLKSFM